MEPKQDKQQLAKDLYLHTEKSRQEIADILDIHRKTLYLWIKHGRWEEIKIAARQAPYMLIQNIYNYIVMIDVKIKGRKSEERCPTPQEVGMMQKLLNMTRIINLNNTGAYMQAYEELIKFLYQKDVPLAQAVVKAADSYITGFLDRGKFYLDDIESENVTESIKNSKRQEEERKAESGKEDEVAHDEVAPHNSCEETGNETVPAEPEQASGNLENTPECGSNVQQCAKACPAYCGDVAITSTADIVPKPAIVNPHEENDNVSLPQNTPKEIFSENVTLPVLPTQETNNKTQDTPIESNTNSQSADGQLQTVNCELPTANCKLDSAYYAALPPSQRPSPFREGNIIWVNNRDDISDDDRKMGDTVRLYTDRSQPRLRGADDALYPHSS